MTFRKLNYQSVIHIARQCGLDGIEWGGDIHVPPGDLLRAREVYQATADAGLAVLSYGSYYKLGRQENPAAAFAPVLETAHGLRAGAIRVWAGTKGSQRCSAREFERIVRDTQIIADMAAAYGVAAAFEYHRGTLTDTGESALALLAAVGRGNVKTYWQPNPELTHERNLAELTAVLPWLENVHVFHWARGGARLPLEDGMPQWRAYMQKIRGRARASILEFVKGDDPAQCARDAIQLMLLR